MSVPGVYRLTYSCDQVYTDHASKQDHEIRLEDFTLETLTWQKKIERGYLKKTNMFCPPVREPTNQEQPPSHKQNIRISRRPRKIRTEEIYQQLNKTKLDDLDSRSTQNFFTVKVEKPHLTNPTGQINKRNSSFA